jgi:hypothetical protein
MINEQKFPFKWMQKLVNTLSISDNQLTSFQIAQKIGSCSSDAGEVVKMLSVLTQYGHVINNSEKWRIEHASSNHGLNPRGFRIQYIQDLLLLLKNLTEISVSVEELALKTKKSELEVLHGLNFLSSITKKGYLYHHKKSFPQKWGFSSWENQSTILE